jgi:hypothetical protein
MPGQKALARFAEIIDKNIGRRINGRDAHYKVYVEGDHVVVQFHYGQVYEMIIVRTYTQMREAYRKIGRYLR